MHALRPSSVVLPTLGALLLLFLLTLASSAWSSRSTRHHDAALVKELGLSDLILSSETRYTRHPSQADYHSAFQDHPAALEHFPSGALILPQTHGTSE